VRQPTRELHNLQAPLDLAGGVLERLPVLRCDHRSQLVRVFGQELPESKQDRRAASQRCLAPALERLARRGDGAIDVVPTGKRDAPPD
jgi:hypothetical protein